MTVKASILIGGIAGVLVVLQCSPLTRPKIDDPVGALSVHLVNGIWGTLALGLFADNATSKAVPPFDVTVGMAQFMVQFKGVLAVGAFTFILSYIVWMIIKVTMGVRVSPEEEQEGLDIGEHGNEAYPNFVINNQK